MKMNGPGIKTRKKFLAVGKASRLHSNLRQAKAWRTFVSSWYSKEMTLISASVIPLCAGATMSNEYLEKLINTPLSNNKSTEESGQEG